MKNVKIVEIHPMLETQYQITFKHINGQTVSMLSGINPLNGEWMYWFDGYNGMWTTNKYVIKNKIKEIRKKSKVYFDNFGFVE